jgi:hypothetical protein
MTIDKRINFRGGGKGDTYQGGSGAPGSAESSGKGKSKGTGGSKGNLGGGGGGQESDYKQYSPPVAPTYNSTNIDNKPVTGNDYRRSQNEFINNFNQNEASRFEPTFFNRNYNPTTLDQFGSSNQPPNYGNAVMGGILGLINPYLGKVYSGYNFLKNTVPQTLNKFKDSPTLMDFYNNMQPTPINNTIDIREKFNRTDNSLSGIESIQTEGTTGLTFQEIQSLINNSGNNFNEIDNQVSKLSTRGTIEYNKLNNKKLQNEATDGLTPAPTPEELDRLNELEIQKNEAALNTTAIV